MSICQTIRQHWRFVFGVVVASAFLYSSSGFAKLDEECATVGECEAKFESYFLSKDFTGFKELYSRLKLSTDRNSLIYLENWIVFNGVRVISINAKATTAAEKIQLKETYLALQSLIRSSPEFSAKMISDIDLYVKSEVDLIDFSMKSPTEQAVFLKDKVAEADGEIYSIQHFINSVPGSQERLVSQFLDIAGLNQTQKNKLLVEAILYGSVELTKALIVKMGSVSNVSSDVSPICELMDRIRYGDDDGVDFKRALDSEAMELFYNSLSDSEKQTSCGDISFKEFVGPEFASDSDDGDVVDFNKVAVGARGTNKKDTVVIYKDRKFSVRITEKGFCSSENWQASVAREINSVVVGSHRYNKLRRQDQVYNFNLGIGEQCHVDIEIRSLESSTDLDVDGAEKQ